MRVDKPGHDPLNLRALLEHERSHGALVAPPARPQRPRGVCAPPGANDLNVVQEMDERKMLLVWLMNRPSARDSCRSGDSRRGRSASW